MIIKYLIIIAFLAVANFSFAQPSILQVSGNIIHGGTVEIAGASFGNKNPAAPLLWDDSTASPPLSTYYDAWLPTDAQQGSYYNMSYREVPFRDVTAST